MMLLPILLCLFSSAFAGHEDTLEGTVVNFNDPKIQGHVAALAHTSSSCLVKTRAPRADVQAYLTNRPPDTHQGRCFVACMLEASNVLYRNQINREMLISLASLINGRSSRVVRRLEEAARLCSARLTPDQRPCVYGSQYNDCLNDYMVEFKFPKEIATEVIKVLPFPPPTVKPARRYYG